jgi:hypothetical protein
LAIQPTSIVFAPLRLFSRHFNSFRVLLLFFLRGACSWPIISHTAPSDCVLSVSPRLPPPASLQPSRIFSDSLYNDCSSKLINPLFERPTRDVSVQPFARETLRCFHSSIASLAILPPSHTHAPSASQ